MHLRKLCWPHPKTYDFRELIVIMTKNRVEICLMSTITNEELSYYNKKFSEFEKKYNIKIIFTRVSWNKAFSWLIESFKNNKAPDIIQLGTTWARTLAYLGYLDPVPSLVIREPLVGWLKECCYLDDKWFAVPWFVDIRALLVHEKILNRVGISSKNIESTKDFYSVCEKLAKKRSKDKKFPLPFAFPVRPDSEILHRFMSWFWALGFDFPSLKPVPAKILSNQIFKKSFKYVSRLIRISNIPRSEVQKHPYVLFREFSDDHRYIFYQCNWELRLGENNGYDSELNYDVIPMPHSSSGGKYWGGGSVLAVSSFTRHRELAWRLVNFITSDDFIGPWIKTNGNLPAFECEFWKKFMHISSVKSGYKQIKNSVAYPAHPMWATVEKILSTGLSNFFWKIVDNPELNVDDRKVKKELLNADNSVINLLNLNWGRE